MSRHARPKRGGALRVTPIAFCVLIAVLALLAVLLARQGSTSDASSGLQGRYVSVVARVSPQVVQIRSPRSLGSGVVIDRRGDIVTNAHVTAGAQRFTVTLAGGVTHRATTLT